MTDPRNGARKARLVQESAAGGTVEAVVLEDGGWLDVVALKQAVTGGDWPPSSRQLRELELIGFGEGIIDPPFNLSLLYDWLYVSSVHGACVSQKVIDIVEIGHRLVGNPALPDGVTPDPAQKTRLEIFVGDPNDQEETFLEIMSKTVTDFEAVGNGYLEAVRGPETAVQPLAVYHMASPTVRVRRDRDRKLGYVQIRGGRRRYFKAYGDERVIDNQTGEILAAGAQIPIERQASEVIHFKMYTHLSEFYGAPTWLSSLSAMLGDMKARDYNIEFFDNKAVPAYAVVAQGGRLTDESKEMLRQFFAHELKGKHHRTVVLDAVPGKDGAQVSVTFEKLAVDIKDASFRLFRQDNAEEILIAHKMPPYRVGWARTGSLGGATAVEMTQIYKESVIEPRQNRFEARLDKLFADVLQVTDWLFRFNDIDARDEVQEATLAKEYMTLGVYSVNTVLEKLGLPTVDGGEVKFIWLPGNPIPVSRLPELAAREDLLPAVPALPPEDGGGLGLGNLRGLADLVQKRAPLRRARERLVKQFTDRVLPLMVAKAEAFLATLPEGRLVAVAEILGAPHAEKRQATAEKQARPLSLSQRRALEDLFRDIDKTYDFDDIGTATEAFMRRVANWAGTAAYAQLGVSGLAFDLKNPAIVATLKKLAGEHILDIRATAKQDLQDLLVEMFFEEGKNPLDIARGIRKNLGDQIRETYRHRSETIARTETGIAQEVTQDEVFRRAGVQTYTWITAGDDKVRPSHRALHGVTVKVGERFANGLRFPLDPQGRAEEIIQCRCDFLPGFEDLPIPEDQMWEGA